MYSAPYKLSKYKVSAYHYLMIKRIIIPLIIFITFSSNAFALNKRGRMGVGLTQQLKSDIPAISLKTQRSPIYAFEALFGLQLSDGNDNMGAGAKIYRIIFDEPLVNFYAAGMGAILKSDKYSASSTGFQFDFTFGSEFSFVGLESLGFSFEFGVSVNQLNDNFTLETVGNHFVVAGIHFYI